ncbi:MAG: TRAP transporter small permease [Burkholderiales bacterium]|nr:TRAP transporter small permease [Burkholderiales bacterium]
MERIVLWVERIAGASLAAVALLVFAGVTMRDLFGTNLPDNFDFSRYLQAIAIFWGLAVATYRNAHILVDVVYEISGAPLRRAIDLFATFVSAAFMALFAYMLVVRFPSVIREHQLTSDLGLRVWPFFAVASLGIVAAAAVALIRLTKLARGQSIERHEH